MTMKSVLRAAAVSVALLVAAGCTVSDAVMLGAGALSTATNTTASPSGGYTREDVNRLINTQVAQGDQECVGKKADDYIIKMANAGHANPYDPTYRYIYEKYLELGQWHGSCW